MTLDDIAERLGEKGVATEHTTEKIPVSEVIIYSALESLTGEYDRRLLKVPRTGQFTSYANNSISGVYNGVPFRLVLYDMEWLVRTPLEVSFISYTGTGNNYFVAPYALSFAAGAMFGSIMTPALRVNGGDQPGIAPPSDSINVVSMWYRGDFEDLSARKKDIAAFARTGIARSYARARSEFLTRNIYLQPQSDRQLDIASKLVELNYLAQISNRG